MAWVGPENRAVIHLNVADFAVAVERVVDRRLAGRPVVVAPANAARAAVYDMSDEAYRAGVRKGMALARARKICRDAAVIPPHPDHYERAMRAFFHHARPYSPLIETGDGNGHLFLDLTGTGRLFGPPPDVAWRIRRAVRSDLGLEPIWSVAPNKLVAKAATRVVKPTGEYIVEPGLEEDFIRPLPLVLIPGLDRNDLLNFREFNVYRAAEAAGWSLAQLDVVFGRRSAFLHRAVRGRDDSPVARSASRKKRSVLTMNSDPTPTTGSQWKGPCTGWPNGPGPNFAAGPWSPDGRPCSFIIPTGPGWCDSGRPDGARPATPGCTPWPWKPWLRPGTEESASGVCR